MPGGVAAPKPEKRVKSAPKPIKPKKRSASEFRRIYGSRERVAWIKSLRCIGCLTHGRTQNHHTRICGMGRKADYATIVPMCDGCHLDLHRWGRTTWESYAGIDLDQLAAAIERAWKSQSPHTGKET